MGLPICRVFFYGFSYNNVRKDVVSGRFVRNFLQNRISEATRDEIYFIFHTKTRNSHKIRLFLFEISQKSISKRIRSGFRKDATPVFH